MHINSRFGTVTHQLVLAIFESVERTALCESMQPCAISRNLHICNLIGQIRVCSWCAAQIPMQERLAVAQDTINAAFINGAIKPPFLQMNELIANFATKIDFFALARAGAFPHIEQAFQASSPKTSIARPETAGLFFFVASVGVPCLCDWL